MESWERENVFALDVEMVEGFCGGNRTFLAGRVVLVRNHPRLDWIKVLDTYIKYDPGEVTNYMTRWSKLEPWMIESGIERQAVVDFLLRLITGHKLVTFSGRGDLASLGLTTRTVSMFVSEHIELQDYFARPNGKPYGLGPLVEYFGYQRLGRPVIIRHNCVDDAQYTLRLYMDHYREDATFSPECYIPTKKEYCAKYGIY